MPQVIYSICAKWRTLLNDVVAIFDGEQRLMQHIPSRTKRLLIIFVFILTIVFSVAPSGQTVAAVNEDFTAFAVNDTAESLVIPGIASMVSNPANSTTIQNFPTPPVPLTGNALYNLETIPADGDGVLTINFTQPQDSYAFDFTINIGAGTRQMIVEGRRAGLTDPVFTDSYDAAVDFGAYNATGVGIIFDQLILSSTAGHWGIDNLVTTDALPGVTIVESGGSTDVAEAGATSDTFAIALDSLPANDVRINLTTNGECTVTSPIDFVAGSFAAQTVTVTANDDAITEAPVHACTISFAIVTADADYGIITIGDLTANVTDDDTAGVTVNPLTISLIEGDGATYDIALDSAPTADVTIDIIPDAAQCSTSTNSITFLAGTTGPQTITATATDDAIAEASPHDCLIGHTATSADVNYDAVPIADVTLNITDNDAPGITVDPLNVALTEGSVTPGTYSITLSTQPVQAVRIDMTVADGQCTTTPAFVNFPAGIVGPLTVDVVAVDDVVAEGAHTCTVQHGVTTTDPAYAGFFVPDVIGNIVDDDVPGVTLDPITVNVAEGGATATYTVVLETQPAAVVSVQITPDAQCTVNGSAVPVNLTFEPAAAPLWNVAQTITVAAVDDPVGEGAHACIIGHQGISTDANYNGVLGDVTGNITDNDIPGYGSVPAAGTPLTINTTTGAAGTATVVISETGTADLTVSTYGVVGDAEVTVAGTAAPFTIVDGGADETLTVTCQSPAAGTFTSVLTVLHNAVGTPATYNVTCNVTGVPGYGSTPAAGTPLTINTTTGVAGTATVVISETGTADLAVSAYGVVGDAEVTVAGTAAPFTIVNGGTDETLTATCLSAVAGTFTSVLTVTHNAAGSPATYDVTCNVTGVPGYGSTPAAGTPLTINTAPGVAGTATVVISETGTADLVVSAYGVVGAAEVTVAGTAAPFTIVDGGADETLTVTCQSPVPGTFTSLLSVTHNAAGSPAAYAVTCTVSGAPGYGSVPAAGTPLTINTTTGVAGTATVVISETGNADLTVNSYAVTGGPVLTVAGTAAPFAIVDGGADQTLIVTCQSAAAGTFTGTLTVTHDAAGSPATYNVTCNVAGVPGYGSLPAAGTPLTINTTTGVAGTATVVISETGTADLSVTGFALTGGPVLTVAGPAVPFDIPDASNATETLTVTCQSAAAGTFAGTLTVNHNAAGSPATYAVTCNVTVAAAPGYGSTPNPGQIINIATTVGTNVNASIVVSETGTASLVVGPIVTAGSPQLSLITPANFTILDGGLPETVRIQCNAAAVGSFSTTVTIPHNAVGSPATYTVNCDVTSAAQPKYSSVPAPGSTINVATTVGSGASAGIQVTNTGTATLNVGTITVTGTGTGQVSLVSPTTFTLNAGLSQTISLQCAATQVGTFTVTVTVPHTGVAPPASPATYTVTCTVSSVGSAPGYGSNPPPGSVINVGTAQIGTLVTTGLFVFETGGSTLNVSAPASGIVITGQNANEFAIVSGLPPFSIVDGGAIQTVTIRCIPLAEGLRIASLTFNTNSPNQGTVTYTLNCTGSLTPVIGTATPVGFVPTVTPFFPTTTVLPPATGKVVEVKGLAIRTGPYLGATLIGVARPGNTYSILARNIDEGEYTWYLIVAGEVTGWVSDRYLEIEGAVENVPFAGSLFDSIDGAPDIGVRLTTNAIIDMRRRPSPRVEIVGTIPSGAEIVVIGRSVQERSTFWLHVSYNGVVGWIPSLPVSIRGPVDSLPVR
jgi:hypothetical protein